MQFNAFREKTKNAHIFHPRMGRMQAARNGSMRSSPQVSWRAWDQALSGALYGVRPFSHRSNCYEIICLKCPKMPDYCRMQNGLFSLVIPHFFDLVTAFMPKCRALGMCAGVRRAEENQCKMQNANCKMQSAEGQSERLLCGMKRTGSPMKQGIRRLSNARESG